MGLRLVFESIILDLSAKRPIWNYFSWPNNSSWHKCWKKDSMIFQFSILWELHYLVDFWNDIRKSMFHVPSKINSVRKNILSTDSITARHVLSQGDVDNATVLWQWSCKNERRGMGNGWEQKTWKENYRLFHISVHSFSYASSLINIIGAQIQVLFCMFLKKMCRPYPWWNLCGFASRKIFSSYIAVVIVIINCKQTTEKEKRSTSPPNSLYGRLII